MSDSGSAIDAKAAFSFDMLNTPQRVNSIAEEIYNRVGSAGIEAAIKDWLDSTPNTLSSEERKKIENTLVLAVIQIEIQAKIAEDFREKHSSFISKLESGSLFNNEQNFVQDSNLFNNASNDWLTIISQDKNKKLPEADYVKGHNVISQAAHAANTQNGGAGGYEKNLRKNGIDPENRNDAKICLHTEVAVKLHELGLCAHPCHTESRAQIEEIAELVGVSYEKLNGMTLTELKEEVKWVSEYEEMAHDKSKYDEFVNTPDPRLEKFRDKDYSSLSRNEKMELAATKRDISHENNWYKLRATLEKEGRTPEEIDEASVRFNSDWNIKNGGFDAAEYSSWMKKIDSELVSNIDDKWIDKTRLAQEDGSRVTIGTFKTFMKNMPDEDLNAFVKKYNPDSPPKTREENLAYLRNAFVSNNEFADKASDQIKASVVEYDKKAVEVTENKAQSFSFSNFFNFNKPPAVEIAASSAQGLAAGGVAGAVVGGALKSEAAQAAFDKLGDAAKAAVEGIKETCSCQHDEKPKPSPQPLAQQMQTSEVATGQPATELASNTPATPAAGRGANG